MRSTDIEPLQLGQYPTPVFRADTLCTESVDLWVKNDGVTAEPYGGNKVRKLELILAEARRRGARRIVTTGAGGSHHVLATTLYASRLGVPVTAVMCPQPWTEHAEATLCASLAAGVEPVFASSMASVPLGVARVLRSGDYFVPAGGSSTLGTLGYVRAVTELLEQIRAGLLPTPDTIIAPLGSGGTVAGILAGVLREGLRARVVGVDVAVAPALARTLVLALARSATRADGGPAGLVRLARALEVDGEQLGRGYGHATSAGERAMEVARGVGLTLDATYTAKAFARALRELSKPPATATEPRTTVLYWHTLSATAATELFEGTSGPLPAGLERLLPKG